VARILSVLLNGRFRKGSLTAMDAERSMARHRDRVAARVSRNEPVQLTLVGFPFKVPNPLKVGDRTLPDLAEVAALMTLERLHLDMQEIYAPGIEVVILNDGAYIANAFSVLLGETYEYTRTSDGSSEPRAPTRSSVARTSPDCWTLTGATVRRPLPRARATAMRLRSGRHSAC